MRSRALPLVLGLTACAALALAAAFVFRNEADVRRMSGLARAFEQRVQSADAALSDIRSGLQAYVAAGQGVAYWTPRVAEAMTTLAGALDALRQSTTSGEAQAALDRATAAITDVQKIEARVRDLVKSGQLLTAGDTIFSDGTKSIAYVAQEIDIARSAERRTVDAGESATRTRQAIVIGSAAAAAGVIVLVLIVLLPAMTVNAPGAPIEATGSVTAPALVAPAPRPPSEVVTAAALAKDFSRVKDVAGLEQLLGRASEALDASGLVVWMAGADGMTLHPMLTHGYSPQIVARIQPMSRSTDNAAAAAFRSGSLQIVLARPGGSSGAIVAPILSPDGCTGVLSAEIRGGAETSEGVQALAEIVASHLVAVMAPPESRVGSPDVESQKSRVG